MRRRGGLRHRTAHRPRRPAVVAGCRRPESSRQEPKGRGADAPWGGGRESGLCQAPAAVRRRPLPVRRRAHRRTRRPGRRGRLLSTAASAGRGPWVRAAARGSVDPLRRSDVAATRRRWAAHQMGAPVSRIFTSLIQSDFSGGGHGNLEAVIQTGDELQHWYRDGSRDNSWFPAQVVVPSGATGAGSLIQSDFSGGDHGNFEVVVPVRNAAGGADLWHYFHDNSDVTLPWQRAQLIAANVAGPGCIIQSDFSGGDHGNFEVVVPVRNAAGGADLWHYFHDNSDVTLPWQRAQLIAANVAGPGCIIQSDFSGGDHGNFEVVVPVRNAAGGADLWHYFHDNSDVTLPWRRAQMIAANVLGAGVHHPERLRQRRPRQLRGRRPDPARRGRAVAALLPRQLRRHPALAAGAVRHRRLRRLGLPDPGGPRRRRPRQLRAARRGVHPVRRGVLAPQLGGDVALAPPPGPARRAVPAAADPDDADRPAHRRVRPHRLGRPGRPPSRAQPHRVGVPDPRHGPGGVVPAPGPHVLLVRGHLPA